MFKFDPQFAKFALIYRNMYMKNQEKGRKCECFIMHTENKHKKAKRTILLHDFFPTALALAGPINDAAAALAVGFGVRQVRQDLNP